jgi:uncharacterized tellurite resistance protein B-like protein
MCRILCCIEVSVETDEENAETNKLLCGHIVKPFEYATMRKLCEPPRMLYYVTLGMCKGTRLRSHSYSSLSPKNVTAMIDAIKNFFDAKIKSAADSRAEDAERQLRVATAALLIEMMNADFECTEEERDSIITLLQQRFEMTADEVNELFSLARQQVENAVSHYQFTSLIKDAFSYEQRVQLIELLWQVAYADETLQKYEEALVRKIADLIYVRHTDFIAAKHRVLTRLGHPE